MNIIQTCKKGLIPATRILFLTSVAVEKAAATRGWTMRRSPSPSEPKAWTRDRKASLDMVGLI